MKERNNKKRASAAGRWEKHSGMLAGPVNAKNGQEAWGGGLPPPLLWCAGVHFSKKNTINRERPREPKTGLGVRLISYDLEGDANNIYVFYRNTGSQHWHWIGQPTLSLRVIFI